MESVDLIGTRLRRLAELLDAGIEGLYAELGIPGFRPRFAPVLIAVGDAGAPTIRQLATEVGVTHSAMSQTVARLVKDGLVDSGEAADGRAKAVTLTTEGHRIAALVRAEWTATARAARALEGEMTHPLSASLDEAIALLSETPFAQRLAV